MPRWRAPAEGSRYAVLDSEARAIEAEIARFLLHAPWMLPASTVREIAEAARP